ncbi:uncharacterized protein [Clytia hemisphaerica]|uniref:uncharacterized protein n=1 Tax=Clytia hemisphaerica TaxID=252671 RepID=UPI0034D44EDF
MSNEDDAKKVQEAHELLNRAMILLSPQAPQPSLPRSSNQTFPTNTSNSSNQDAESNFFSCFPAARGTPNPLRRKPKGSRTQPYFIPPSTWTHDFFLLASKHAEKSPDRLTVLELNNAGLGKKKVVFQDKKGDHSHIRKTLESHYPMLRSQNGAFSLLRCESGGSGVRGLKQIGPSNAGYTVPLLKDVCKSSLIYIKPLNTSIDIISIDQPTTVTEEDNEYAKAVCNICKIDIPLTLFEEHQNICSSKENTERIDEAAPDPDFPNLNQRLEQLKVLFPKGNEREVWLVQLSSFDSITTDQAVEKYLQLNEIEEKKSGSEAASGSRNEIEETNFERFDDMLDHYRNKYLTEEKTCSLNVQREELWRVAQAFYKKAINDPEILFRKFEVNFSKDTGEEESVDAGALKIEFFELLLVELKNRCLEGDEFSLIPRKSDSVNFIILGLAIAHSVLHGGPGQFVGSGKQGMYMGLQVT